MMQPAGSSYAAQRIWMTYDAAATKAAKEVIDGGGAMEADMTSMKVLEFIARRGGDKLNLGKKGNNLDAMRGKYMAEIKRDFSNLYKAYKEWDAGGKKGADPLGKSSGSGVRSWKQYE